MGKLLEATSVRMPLGRGFFKLLMASGTVHVAKKEKKLVIKVSFKVQLLLN